MPKSKSKSKNLKSKIRPVLTQTPNGFALSNLTDVQLMLIVHLTCWQSGRHISVNPDEMCQYSPYRIAAKTLSDIFHASDDILPF